MSHPEAPSASTPNALPLTSLPARRSALGRAIGAAYLTRLFVALLASYPFVATVVSASGILEFATGDGKLFEPGGLYLLELLLRQRAQLIELVAPTAGLLVLGALLGVGPEWLMLRALAPPATTREPAPAARALLRLGALALGSWVARGALVFVTAALAMTARSWFAGARDERLPLLATGAVVLLGLLGWACLSVLHDLAAIEVVVRAAPPLAAIDRGLSLARRHALALALRYAGWTLATGAVLAAGAAAAAAFDVSTGAGLAAAASLLLHQLALLAQVGLHAAWLSSALGATHAQADAFL